MTKNVNCVDALPYLSSKQYKSPMLFNEKTARERDMRFTGVDCIWKDILGLLKLPPENASVKTI